MILDGRSLTLENLNEELNQATQLSISEDAKELVKRAIK